MGTNQKFTELLNKQISVYGKEVRFLEFKSNYQDVDKLGQYISALSNGATLDNQDFGYLFFGVQDGTLEIKGTTFDSSKQKAKGNQALELYLRQHISPKIIFRIEEFYYNDSIRIVVFTIPAARREPTCYFGKPYIRVDSHTTELTPYVDWMREIYMSDEDWSAHVINDATLDWLEPKAIAEARKGYKERYPDWAKASDDWTDKVFLDKAKLTINGQITRTTLLLLGKEEMASHVGNISQIVWKCHQDGQTFGDIFSIPFLLSTTQLLNRIRNYRVKIYPDNSLIPAEIWKYDTKTILECLHNCIAHQCYTDDSRIIVTETPEQITFENHGGFYDGSYEDYIYGKKTPQRYRNKALVQAMVGIKMIDTQGYGIHTMFVKQKERFLPMPDYSDSTQDMVILHLPGTVIDENYSRLLIEKTDINLETAIMLDMIQKGNASKLSKNAVDHLRSMKLIEGRRPNIFISKNIAKISGKAIDYSKHKGLSSKKCEELICDALSDHGALSKKQISELIWNILPDVLSDKQKHSKVHNILSKLKANGHIDNTGLGPSAKWFKK